MRIRGLPSNLLYGSVNISLLSDCRLLQQCDICSAFSLEYFACPSSHSICSFCTNVSALGIAAWSRCGSQVSCPICMEHVRLLRIKIPAGFVRRLKFKCDCDFVGTLTEIETHLITCRLNITCPNMVVASGPGNECPSARCISPLDMRKCIRDNMLNELKQVSGMLKEVFDLNQQLSRDVRAMKLKVYGERELFQFDYKSLRIFKSAEVPRIVGGVRLRVQMKLTVNQDETWIGLFVEGSHIERGISLCPMKKTIVLRVLDRNNEAIERAEMKTLANGCFVDDSSSFVRDNYSRKNTGGFPKFLSGQRLLEPGVLDDGQIKLLVEVRPFIEN